MFDKFFYKLLYVTIIYNIYFEINCNDIDCVGYCFKIL